MPEMFFRFSWKLIKYLPVFFTRLPRRCRSWDDSTGEKVGSQCDGYIRAARTNHSGRRQRPVSAYKPAPVRTFRPDFAGAITACSGYVDPKLQMWSLTFRGSLWHLPKWQICIWFCAIQLFLLQTALRFPGTSFKASIDRNLTEIHST